MMDEGEKGLGRWWGYKCQSIYCTLSQIHGFHILKLSIRSLLLAQPYCIQKVLHEGRSVHIIKPNKQNNSQEPILKKYQGKKRKYTYKSAL